VERWKKRRSEIDDNQEEEPRRIRRNQNKVSKSESHSTHCNLLSHTFACERGFSSFVSYKRETYQFGSFFFFCGYFIFVAFGFACVAIASNNSKNNFTKLMLSKKTELKNILFACIGQDKEQRKGITECELQYLLLTLLTPEACLL
jgi:hypothetical protein